MVKTLSSASLGLPGVSAEMADMPGTVRRYIDVFPDDDDVCRKKEAPGT
jgi:hypothetical protein